MNRLSESRELLLKALLLGLNAAGGAGMTIPSLRNVALMGGFDDAEHQEIGEEMGYLEDKGLVAKLDKVLSPEIKRWRITADGRDWLAQNGG